MSGVQKTIGGCGGRCDSCWALDRCGGCRQACSVHNCWDNCEQCLWTCCQDRDETKRDRRRLQIENTWNVKWEPFEIELPDLISQVNGRIKELWWPMYAVSIKMLINWRQSMDGHPFKWRDNITGRSVCQIPDRSKAVLTFTARDPILDWFYLRMKEPALAEKMRSWGFDYTFAVNFSHYFEMPRMEQIVNTARTLESIDVFQKAGMKVIPQVQWVDLIDRESWAKWLMRENVGVIGMNFQMLKTTLKYRGIVADWTQHLEEVEWLMDRTPDHMVLIAQGVSIPRRLAILKKRFGKRVVSMSGNPWCLANYGLGIQDGERVKLDGWKGKTPELFIRNAERLLAETQELIESDDLEDDRVAITKVRKEDEPEEVGPKDLDGQGFLFDMSELGENGASDCGSGDS